MTVRNTGTTATTSWTVTWTFQNGQVISQLWGGLFQQSGANVTVRPEAWNAAIPPNGTTSFGFIASAQAANSVPSNIACVRS